MRTILTRALLLATALASLAACDRREPRALGAERTTTVQMAAIFMAEARCEREARCSPAGEPRSTAAPAGEVCMDRVRSGNFADFTPIACPEGLDTERLRACLQEIRDDRCGAPFYAIGHIDACQVSQLCFSPTGAP